MEHDLHFQQRMKERHWLLDLKELYSCIITLAAVAIYTFPSKVLYLATFETQGCSLSK